MAWKVSPRSVAHEDAGLAKKHGSPGKVEQLSPKFRQVSESSQDTFAGSAGSRGKTLVVVPTYNEIENLERLVGSVFAQGAYDLLVVDDGSPDGTGELAEQLKERYPGRLDVIHRAGKLGLGTAYIAGFGYALEYGYELVFEMDCDFSHDPRELPRLARAAEHADLVIGSRYVAGGATPDWPLIRRLISRGGSLYTRLVLGIGVGDLTSGFKCFRRGLLAALDLNSIGSTGFGFQVEVNWRAYQLGFRIVEVPITFVDRRAGRSKMSSGIFFEALTMVWRLRLAGNRGSGLPVR